MWASYLAERYAMQSSPREREIKEAVARRHAEIGQAIRLLSQTIPVPKFGAHRQGEAAAQFHAVFADLLEEQGSSIASFRRSAEQVLEAARIFDLEHTKLLVALERGLEDGLFQRKSEQAMRQKLMLSLLDVLKDEGCDHRVGIKTLVTLLLMDLERPSQMGKAEEEAYRKSLARQIREAVKASKGA